MAEVSELLDLVEDQINSAISMIEEVRFLSNELNSQKSQLQELKSKFDAGELSGDVFKKLKSEREATVTKTEGEITQKVQSVLDAINQVTIQVNQLKTRYAARASTTGLGTVKGKTAPAPKPSTAPAAMDSKTPATGTKNPINALK